MNAEEKTSTPAGLDEFAYFGYQPVAPAEKEKLVHRHFDTVSARYDFMNTLLSFGMHYPWKWTAVRLLGLRAGDRVLDVCGGTADLALLAARRIGPAGRVVVYDINRAMMAGAGPSSPRRAWPPALPCSRATPSTSPVRTPASTPPWSASASAI